MKPYNPHDRYLVKAKREGFRARSVYKLQELDENLNLFHSGMKVLDIGAAPGSWLQYVSRKIDVKGLAVGLDLQEIEPIAKNVKTFICDITDHDQVGSVIHQLNWKNADIIISDIAPNPHH